MQFTDDPIEVVTVAVIILLFVSMIVVHIGFAFRVGLRHSWSRAWKLLGSLTAFTVVVWFVLYVAIGIANILDAPSKSGAARSIHELTFGLPYALNIPARFLPIPEGMMPVWLRLISVTTLLATELFLLALLPYRFGRIVSKKKAGNHLM